MYSNTSAGIVGGINIGIDSTATPLGTNLRLGTGNSATEKEACISHISTTVLAGYHKVCWLEWSLATGTGTFYGNSVGAILSGLWADIDGG